MKNTNIQNNNGITICDSIVMSVKRKSHNFRKLEAVVIAAAGYIAVILSFLGMFSFRFNESTVFWAAAGFSLFYITLTVIEGKAIWALTGSVFVFAACAYKSIHRLSRGFKYVYNVIYNESFDTDIKYYKNLNPRYEEENVTVLFVFGVWLLALVIYYFTVCRHNPILPLMVTFPIIEIGLYNGIEIPVFWGILVIAYWLALLGMSTIDVGEYSGGRGGFVRRDNLFFPKRQMKLKVTEKCGVFIIAVILFISVIAYSVMQITNYKRSDELNQKRRDISYAISQFTFDDVAESLSKITSAFGFTIDSNSHKLGNKSSIRYKNTTDLIATFDGKCSNTVYIKDYAGSVYNDNEWRDLDKSAYEDEIFSDFKQYEIYPQDFVNTFTKLIDPSAKTISLDIEYKLKKTKGLSPYGTENFNSLDYVRDTMVSDGTGKKQSYRFTEIDRRMLEYNLNSYSTGTYQLFKINSADSKDYTAKIRNYCIDNHYGNSYVINSCLPQNYEYRYANPKVILSEFIQDKYKYFVFENYLQIPDTEDMEDVRNAYSDIIDMKNSASTAADKLMILDLIRNRMANSTEYTLSPGKTPSNRDFVSYFLNENHKGYCVHYATSGVILARMAGIPARYATGYIITADDFNSDSHTGNDTYEINVKDNRSHAWAEIYLEDFGWIPYEFTASYSNNSVPHEKPKTTTVTNNITTISSTRTIPVTTTKNNTHISNASTGSVSSSSTAAVIPPQNGNNDSGAIPLFIKRIIAVIVSIAAVIGLILLRRHITVTVRRKKLTSGESSRRIGEIYRYAEILLSELGIKQGDMQYIKFAEYADEQLGNIHIKQGDFIRMTDIALRSGFGKTSPTPVELKECLETTNSIARSIYEKSSFFGRLSLKYFKCII